jgi:hypothetical protein
MHINQTFLPPVVLQLGVLTGAREASMACLKLVTNHIKQYRGTFAQGKNCEVSRDSRCHGTALQTRPLLGNRFVTHNNGVTGKRCSLRRAASYMMQQ